MLCVRLYDRWTTRIFLYLTAHFGYWHTAADGRVGNWQVEAGCTYKLIERRQVVFTTTSMCIGKRADLAAVQLAHDLFYSIQTAFIERLNLTLRQSIAPLTCNTWSLSHSQDHLLLHLEWGRLYYHFLRSQQSLGQRTPAMMLGLTDHVWTIREFVHAPLII